MAGAEAGARGGKKAGRGPEAAPRDTAGDRAALAGKLRAPGASGPGGVGTAAEGTFV